ncbi:MAG TPA: energy transducer TonB [Alphaproteobacteria bacterium]|jgi:hypothetical protein|nr:energy transducer TonB [Alphaproteobacteria bacterium]
MTTRASNDFLVVGVVGLVTALFLTQLLIVSQQIVAANNHVRAELDAERTAVPVMPWLTAPRRLQLKETWPPSVGCCYSLRPSKGNPTAIVRPEYPPRALTERTSGYVDFRFLLMPDGSIASPKVTYERPVGYGFAAAAMKVFPRWKFAADPNRPKAGESSFYRVTFRFTDDPPSIPEPKSPAAR